MENTTQKEWKPEELLAFEEKIITFYENGRIRAPVHLSGGNEEQLIEIFKNIKPTDWVFSTHRNHYHALLHGISPEWIEEQILEGNSICLNNADHNFFSSAIMGGIIPIALGTAFALKRKGSDRKVWAFIGDMASYMGVFHEALRYAEGHDLPITFIVEDNGMSIETPTKKVWGEKSVKNKVMKYVYTRKFPHHGIGKWVTF